MCNVIVQRVTAAVQQGETAVLHCDIFAAVLTQCIIGVCWNETIFGWELLGFHISFLAQSRRNIFKLNGDKLVLELICTNWNRVNVSTNPPIYQLSALDFWLFLVWISSLIDRIFFLLWTGFLQATQAVKIQFKLGKNPVHQTWNFKLENVKNQVQIYRGFRLV